MEDWQAGITLIEMVVVLAILGVLAAIGFAALRPAGRAVDLQTASQEAVAVLDRTRERTLGSEDTARWGIHFEADRYVVFKGDTYDSLAGENEVHLLDPSLEFYDIAFLADDESYTDSDVVFNRLEGTTGDSGSVGIRLKNDVTNTKTIEVLPSGQAGFEGTTALTDTRVTDTRHVHFDLGWSIQEKTTLTFYFTDPENGDVQHDIVMTDFFNADFSVFDWEEGLDVNGNLQTLRVHTHSLTDADTGLSITRDGRYNTLPVSIYIDGQEIVSYQADNSAVVGNFGGDMTVQ